MPLGLSRQALSLHLLNGRLKHLRSSRPSSDLHFSMTPFRFTTLAHKDHVFCSPMRSARADALVELLDLAPSSRVVDIGCGKGEMLLRTVQRYDTAGVGVDPNPEFLQTARANAEARKVNGRMEWHEARAADVTLEPASFDCALSFGASHAFGQFAEALAALAALVRPGGEIMIADPYWRIEPAEEFLAFLGAKSTVHLTHAGNEAAGLAVGLMPLYSCVSNADEWDHYEGLFCRAVERFAQDHPQDPDAQPYRERIRAWRDCYHKWSRDTLGFGFYLFLKP
jgi:SAM-dependent methyltransferase